jgi:hypothetical protein
MRSDADQRCRRAAPAREAARSVSCTRFRGALSPTRSPRVPPVTMLGLRRTAPLGGGGPNIVKDGTPARARCRRPALRVGHLTLEAPTSRVHVSARRTAPYRRVGDQATSDERPATARRRRDEDEGREGARPSCPHPLMPIHACRGCSLLRAGGGSSIQNPASSIWAGGPATSGERPATAVGRQQALTPSSPGQAGGPATSDQRRPVGWGKTRH